MESSNIKKCIIINSGEMDKPKLNIFYLAEDEIPLSNIDEILSKFAISYRKIKINEIPLNPCSQKVDYLSLLDKYN